MADDEPTDDFDVGVAGRSSQHEYERRKGAREERIKGRVGNRLGRFLLAVTDEPQTTTAWLGGASGERKVADALAKVAGIRVLHDRGVPRSQANIDLIVIGAPGVFVVDAKDHAGTVRIRDVGGFFKRDERLFVGRRDCTKLAEGMAWQVAAVQSALTAAIGEEPPPAVTPVLCFARADWPMLFPPDRYRDVRLESAGSLKKLVSQEGPLTPQDVERFARLLAAALPSK
jgi:hypothetical protein